MGLFDLFKKNENILNISLGPLGSPPIFTLDRSSGQLTITAGPFKSITFPVEKMTNLQLEQKGLTTFELHVFIDNIRTYSLDCPPVKYQELQDCFNQLIKFQKEKSAA